MNVAEHIITCLESLNISRVFGVRGDAIEPLYNAIAQSNIQHIATSHETQAAFAAAGYYLRTGTMGVCCATAGPSATNMITGVASAMGNNIPLVVITAQPLIAALGNVQPQDSSGAVVDCQCMYRCCAKYSTFV